MLILPISQRRFELYALSLDAGIGFHPFEISGAWQTKDKLAAGCVLFSQARNEHGFICLRRRVDHCWVLVREAAGFADSASAWAGLADALAPGDPPLPLPPGAKRRPLLLDTNARQLGATFALLTSTAQHFPALMTVGEAYLAMPNPDDNFVADFQTANFDARLWELYLCAALREQGLEVRQDQVSPDFLIRSGDLSCYIEAVTANPVGEKSQGFARWVHAPADRDERLSGAPAIRFAKTLRSKTQREYHKLPHVQDAPFAFAIADFHASGSMVWSREALPVYLFGRKPVVAETEAGMTAEEIDFAFLGESGIPAGLFKEPAMSWLSGVISSNAATLAKFNRMGLLAGFEPRGLKMVRSGHFFDRTPGTLQSIPFEYDVLSAEYAALWPGGEQWCQELEVFHNPLADRPIAFDLLPGATHWFEQDGEIVARSPWRWSVLASTTEISWEA